MEERAIVVLRDEGDLYEQEALRDMGYEVDLFVPRKMAIRSEVTGVVVVPEPCGKENDEALNWALEHFPNAQFLDETLAPLGEASITVEVRKVGFHHWKEAPAEVAYLRASHRHVFVVRFSIEDLSHNDRDQEFHLVQKWVTEEFDAILVHAELLGMSCEMMAQKLCILGRVKYKSSIICEVSEDDENSAMVRL